MMRHSWLQRSLEMMEALYLTVRGFFQPYMGTRERRVWELTRLSFETVGCPWIAVSLYLQMLSRDDARRVVASLPCAYLRFAFLPKDVLPEPERAKAIASIRSIMDWDSYLSHGFIDEVAATMAQLLSIEVPVSSTDKVDPRNEAKYTLLLCERALARVGRGGSQFASDDSLSADGI